MTTAQRIENESERLLNFASSYGYSDDGEVADCLEVAGWKDAERRGEVLQRWLSIFDKPSTIKIEQFKYADGRTGYSAVVLTDGSRTVGHCYCGYPFMDLLPQSIRLRTRQLLDQKKPGTFPI